MLLNGGWKGVGTRSKRLSYALWSFTCDTTHHHHHTHHHLTLTVNASPLFKPWDPASSCSLSIGTALDVPPQTLFPLFAFDPRHTLLFHHLLFLGLFFWIIYGLLTITLCIGMAYLHQRLLLLVSDSFEFL